MNKLTAIIPFLNEGIEVENTISSIKHTAKGNVDILLINDNSSDDFDYEYIAKKYNAKYIKNEERKGVAQSRNIGVSQITTPYFILLDAHMRFYQDDWWIEALKYIETNDRAVYCLRCLPIDKLGKFQDSVVRMGAKVSLYGNDFYKILEPIWIKLDSVKFNVMEIPCILGATYIMSKRYWDYIKGLSMLKYYGADETYLSLKVWLEGGKCVSISNIVVGHIFRTEGTIPYKKFWAHSIFNKLLISETLLSKDYNWYVHSVLYNFNPNAYMQALAELIKLKNEIDDLRVYYKSIFTKDFEDFKTINANFINNESIPTVKLDNKDNHQILKLVYDYIYANHTKTVGLGIGGLGEFLFLSQYANIYEPENLPIIKIILDELLETCFIKHPHFLDGISGFALGLNYLNLIFPEFDIDDKFHSLDEKLYSAINKYIESLDYSILTGASGIGLYFLKRKPSPLIELNINILLKYIDAYIFHQKENITISDLLQITYFLLEAHEKGYNVLTPLEQISEVILSVSDISFYSNSVSTYFLFNIGRILKNDLEQTAYQALLSLATKRETIALEITDISVINGSSALVFVFNMMYKNFNENIFFEASQYWKRETLVNITSILTTVNHLSEYQKSFIYGIAGAAFVCLEN